MGKVGSFGIERIVGGQVSLASVILCCSSVFCHDITTSSRTSGSRYVAMKWKQKKRDEIRLADPVV